MTTLLESPGTAEAELGNTSRERLRRAGDVATDLAIGVLTVTLLLLFGNDLGYLPSTGLLVWVAGIATGAAFTAAGLLTLAARVGAPSTGRRANGSAGSGT